MKIFFGGFPGPFLSIGAWKIKVFCVEFVSKYRYLTLGGLKVSEKPFLSKTVFFRHWKFIVVNVFSRVFCSFITQKRINSHKKNSWIPIFWTFLRRFSSKFSLQLLSLQIFSVLLWSLTGSISNLRRIQTICLGIFGIYSFWNIHFWAYPGPIMRFGDHNSVLKMEKITKILVCPSAPRQFKVVSTSDSRFGILTTN